MTDKAMKASECPDAPQALPVTSENAPRPGFLALPRAIGWVRQTYERRRQTFRPLVHVRDTGIRVTVGQVMVTLAGGASGLFPWFALHLSAREFSWALGLGSFLGYLVGALFFPAGTLTPLGPVSELAEMTDSELAEAYELNAGTAQMRRFIRYLEEMRYQRALEDWETRVIQASRGSLIDNLTPEAPEQYHVVSPGLETPAEYCADSIGPETREQPRTRRTQELHEEILGRWQGYELDLAKLIDFPTMTDVRVPETAAMIRAMRRADDARQKGTPGEYYDAVLHFQTAFEAAEQEARHQATSTLPETDRTKLKTAKQLLAIAENNAATEPERQTAYRQMRKLLDGLITIPKPALNHLEQHTRLQITSQE